MISSIRRDSYNDAIKERRSKNGTADSMLGKKSGTALAGPAAPATTALV